MFTSMPNLLLIGGATRNVGKTTLTVKIIEKFSAEIPIIALKIKTIRDGDEAFHGRLENLTTEDFRITEETNPEGDEDSSKMLRAGAVKVFRVRTKISALGSAFNQIAEKNTGDFAFVCESNSLREFIAPGLFLMIKPDYSQTMKPSAESLEHSADRIIATDGFLHYFDIETLKFENGIWKLF